MNSMEETLWLLQETILQSLLQTQECHEVIQFYTETLPKFINSLLTLIYSQQECMLTPLIFGRFSMNKYSYIRWTMARFLAPKELQHIYQDCFIKKDSFLSIHLTSLQVKKITRCMFGTMMLLGLMKEPILKLQEMAQG